MSKRLLRADGAVVGAARIEGAGVLVEGDRIVAVGPPSELDPGDAVVEDVEGTLLPGAIDLQVNGAGGASVDEATPEALDRVAEAVLAGGATAFLPTLITAPFDDLLAQTAAVAAWVEGWRGNGARPLGLHLEGPFLEVPGAHDESCFLDPDPDRVEALLAAARGRLRLVTLAPGRTGAVEATARLQAAGVAVAIGHARSTDGLTACVDAGAALVTHLFNAMGPLHHRDPGIAGLALDEERLACSLIVDGAHVHPAMVRNAWRCLGPERTVLVTDAVAASGMPDGEYALAGMRVFLENGVVRDGDGRLAGSALTMRAAVEGFRACVPGADAVDLARVVAAVPARILGDRLRGRLAPDAAAEIGVLGPAGTLEARIFRQPDHG